MTISAGWAACRARLSSIRRNGRARQHVGTKADARRSCDGVLMGPIGEGMNFYPLRTLLIH